MSSSLGTVKKKIFICFDYDNDRRYRHLLSALSENTGSAIQFEDLTPEEIQSYDVGRIKAALTSRIKNSTHILAIVGKHANDRHRDSLFIGTRNWQWWEIEKGREEELGIIAVKIENSNSTPEPLLGSGASWARSFSVDSIVNAINAA